MNLYAKRKLTHTIIAINLWPAQTDSACSIRYVVQRYIDKPYLVGGKKFDMRIYCFVPSFSPLVVRQIESIFVKSGVGSCTSFHPFPALPFTFLF